MWHVTQDMWYVTHDTWHLTGQGRWNFCQNFSSLALTGLMGQWEVILCQPLWSYRQFRKRMSHSINQWINYEGVYRTAPATPGLSKIERLGSFQLAWHSVTPCDTTFRGFIGTFPKNYFSSYFSWTGPNGNISPSATAVLKQLWAQPL